MTAQELPDEIGGWGEEEYTPKNEYEKETLIHSFIHGAPTTYQALFWVPRAGSERGRQGPCSLVTQAGGEMVNREAHAQTG